MTWLLAAWSSSDRVHVDSSVPRNVPCLHFSSFLYALSRSRCCQVAKCLALTIEQKKRPWTELVRLIFGMPSGKWPSPAEHKNPPKFTRNFMNLEGMEYTELFKPEHQEKSSLSSSFLLDSCISGNGW